ncbi:Uncharacterized protein Rs2_51953 [Raphanus sativus]|nr:Uncharacterized protein Rs2_51953 [Raphanus sativus]
MIMKNKGSLHERYSSLVGEKIPIKTPLLERYSSLGFKTNEHCRFPYRLIPCVMACLELEGTKNLIPMRIEVMERSTFWDQSSSLSNNCGIQEGTQKWGETLGSAFRQELANLDKDPDNYKDCNEQIENHCERFGCKRSYVNDQEDDDVSGSPLLAYADYNQETGSRNQIQFSGVEDDNMELVCFHQRNRSSESRTNRPRSSRRNRKKRRSERNRHGFTQDSFTVLLENREQQLRQYSESSSSSPIHDRSGTTTPTEDICEKLKIDLDSVAKVKREESETESRRDSSKKSVLRWGLSFFSVVVAGLASFMWVHLQDDMMMPPHLVPT